MGINETYNEDANPLVSVTMLVYNHEKWLSKAIESIMMQQTKFKYNLIIGEDCSTDGSRAIVEKYKMLYPDKIIALLNSHNLGMKDNADNVWRHACSKYVACCEGDDYWTDPYKLQKQVDFLESHREYSAIYHSSHIVDGEGNPLDIPMGNFVYDEDGDFSWESASRMELPGQAASYLVKNPKYFADKYLLDMNGKIQVLHGDHTGSLLFMSYGKIRKCHEPVSAYRRTYEGSSFNAASLGNDLHYYLYVGALETAKYLNLFAPIYIDNQKMAYNYLLDFFRHFFDSHRGKLKNIFIMFKYNPILFIKFLTQITLSGIISQNKRNDIMVKLLKESDEDKILPSVPDYIFFGTGLVGEQCYHFFEVMGWTKYISAVWDNNKDKQGQKWHELPVLTPGEGTEENTEVIITSRRFVDDMKEQIQAMNCVGAEKIRSFDDWVDAIVCRAAEFSWKTKVFDFMFRYEPKWRVVAR